MKLQNSKRKLYSALLMCGMLGLSIDAQALTLDTKIGEANLGNSGDATELNALAGILGVDPGDLTMDLKLNSNDPGFNVVADSVSGQWVIDVDPNEPGYFLLKFGTGGTSATADTFFFANIGELTKLVFSNDQVQNLSGGDCGANGSANSCNIDRLSHYDIFNGGDGGGGGGGSIPEPASLFLMGAGLMGLGFSRSRKQ
jgi:hypothetical protein